MKKLIVAAAALIFMMTGSVALAATSDVAVNASIAGTCQFNSNAAVAFGVLDQASTGDKAATGSVVFWCTKNASYTLSDEANAGTPDGVFAGNLSDGGTGTIPYSLLYTLFSGSGAGKSAPITSIITGAILNSNYVDQPAGSYSDTVTFTISP